jgi:hypothetical protein
MVSLFTLRVRFSFSVGHLWHAGRARASFEKMTDREMNPFINETLD